jgi:integrase
MIGTAIYTGMRKGELFGLRWTDVHLDIGRIDVERSYGGLPKSGKAREAWMHPDLVVILREWKRRCPTPAGLVFPVEGRMGTEYETLGLGDIMKAAGVHVPQKVWHCLRHTFASHAVMSGVSLYEVQKLLGHGTAEMTQIYAKLGPKHLQTQVARISFAMPVAGVADMGEERRKRAADGT